ncbi:hypothetical protein C7447_10638 [Tenacibaculum adriaticum]|uniref:Chloroplast import component protein (Tic20) n=1 Tax=Tenacibaculum adriaticum TaxID=413713 RepID=A0A5S5DPX4_9FLAO|nr:hypothetical protein [Tenacibaculum adriaticum]TYP96739.1 hypothetical protein C7447_10638 [Tenacibaculum adriaticum]
MENQTAKEGQLLAIISHFWIIGTLISWLLNLKKQNSFTSFYIRQMIGWHLLLFLNGWLIYNFFGGFIKWILGGILAIFWLMSIFGAITEKERLIPFFGEYFQNFFRSL